jgi:photosystem II stability/assembly factor-like uncharacterized protein
MSLRYTTTFVVLFLAIPFGNSAFGAGWEAIGPFGGHAHRIAMDPSDSSHLYATTKNGQIYQSMDSGGKWSRLPFSLTPASSLNAFIINPANPNEIYAGVARNFATMDDAGVYKSEDAGLHWTKLTPTKDWSVFALAIHPTQTNIIVAGAEQGVFRSDNAGLTWKQISPANHPQIKSIMSVTFGASNPDVLYAGTTHLPWKTINGGLTWQAIHEGMADDSDVFSIVISRTNPLDVLVGVCGGIYRSESGGARWIKGLGVPSDSRRTHQIIQDPVNARVFYAATAYGLWKSVDKGVNWSLLNSYPYIVNSFVIDPKDPQKIYIATDRSGLLKSVDGGKTFVPSNAGFVNRSIGRIISEDALYVTSVYEGDFGGIFTTLDQGGTWALSANQVALKGKNIISFAVSPGNAAWMFAGTYDGLLQSVDAGKTWQVVAALSGKSSSGKVYDIAFSEIEPSILYAATDHGLYKSKDAGKSWNRIPSDVLNTTVYKLALAPADSNLMAARTDRGIWLSRNGGNEWTLVDLGKGTRVLDLAFSFAKKTGVFAATSEGLLASEDDGQSWKRIENGLQPQHLDQVLLLRDKPERIYVLRRDSQQMWVSENSGSEWHIVETHGLEGTALRSMSIAAGMPFVVTENHGVFRLQ